MRALLQRFVAIMQSVIASADLSGVDLQNRLQPAAGAAFGPEVELLCLCWHQVLRKIASKEESQLGDTSTLADPGVVNQLLSNRP